MSAGNKVDSVLVIRARDEATKAVTAIGSALEQLIGTQKKVAAGSETAAGGMQQILGVLAQLDRAYAKTADAGDAGAAALERQNRAIAANKAQYTALEAQQRGAARAAEQLRVALVDALLTNGNADVLRAQIGEVTDEMRRLESEATKLRIFSEQQEDAAQKSRGSWAEATRSLGNAWQDFLDVLSDTAPIKEIAKELEGLGRIASQTIRAIAGAQSAADVAAQIARAKQVIANKEAAKGANPGLAGALDADIAILRKQVAGLEKQYAALNGTQKQVNDTIAVRGDDPRHIGAADRRCIREHPHLFDRRVRAGAGRGRKRVRRPEDGVPGFRGKLPAAHCPDDPAADRVEHRKGCAVGLWLWRTCTSPRKPYRRHRGPEYFRVAFDGLRCIRCRSPVPHRRYCRAAA